MIKLLGLNLSISHVSRNVFQCEWILYWPQFEHFHENDAITFLICLKQNLSIRHHRNHNKKEMTQNERIWISSPPHCWAVCPKNQEKRRGWCLPAPALSRRSTGRRPLIGCRSVPTKYAPAPIGWYLAKEKRYTFSIKPFFENAFVVVGFFTLIVCEKVWSQNVHNYQLIN